MSRGYTPFEILGVAPLTVAVMVAFWKGDDLISKEAGNSVSGYLNSLIPEKKPFVVFDALHALIVRIFGKHHFSLNGFLRSSAASLAFLLLISVCMGLVLGANMNFYILVFFFGIGPNVLGDFFSLGQTRLLLKLVLDRKTSIWLAVLLDTILTILIFSLALYVGAYFIENAPFELGRLIPSFVRLGFPPEIERNGFQYFGLQLVLLAPLLTTFLTSVWLWAALIGSAIIKAMPFLKFVLPINEKPIRSIGILSGLILLPILSLSGTMDFAIYWSSIGAVHLFVNFLDFL